MHLTLYAPTPQNDQTHSNNSSAKADGLFEFVDHLLGLALEGLKRVCKFFLVFLCIERYCLKSEEKRVSGAPEILALLQRKTEDFLETFLKMFSEKRDYIG